MIEPSTGHRVAMTQILRDFSASKIDAQSFVSLYSSAWRIWRDSDQRDNVGKALANAFDRAFTAADCYKPPGDTPRTPWDIDEEKLRFEIEKISDEITKLSC
jgi:hypothetical protein